MMNILELYNQKKRKNKFVFILSKKILYTASYFIINFLLIIG